MDSTVYFQTILENEVTTDLRNLIHTKQQHLCPHTCTTGITNLFNASLTSGQIPSEWKKANVPPIPKSTTTYNSIYNFRPISVLPIIAKVFESLIHHQLYTIPIWLSSCTLYTRCSLAKSRWPENCPQSKWACWNYSDWSQQSIWLYRPPYSNSPLLESWTMNWQYLSRRSQPVVIESARLALPGVFHKVQFLAPCFSLCL